jgi:putative membrane protein
MARNDELLLAAQFDSKLRSYWFLQVLLICVVTLVGIVVVPFWVLGWGQWYVRRAFDALRLELHERTLVVKRGILFKVEKTIPLDKIQDLTVKEGPLLRFLGLSSLKVETAGQGTPGASEADLVGIVDPREFRDRVLAQRDATAGSRPVASTLGREPDDTVKLLTEIRDLLRDSVGQG